MSLSRIFLMLCVAYAIVACGGGGSGSGHVVYSDSGSYTPAVDENGNAVPLMLTSSADGKATVTSDTTGKTYDISTVDENGNPVGGVTITFTEKSAEDLANESVTTYPQPAQPTISEDDLGYDITDNPAVETFPVTIPTYSGPLAVVAALDPSGKYEATITIVAADSQTTSDSSVKAKDVLPVIGIRLELPDNINEGSGATWDDWFKSRRVGLRLLAPLDYTVSTLDAIHLSTMWFPQGGNYAVLFQKNGETGIAKTVEYTNFSWDQITTEDMKNMAAEAFGGSAADYDRKGFYTEQLSRILIGGKMFGVMLIKQMDYDTTVNYPADYTLNNVYAQELTDDVVKYYYLGYLNANDYHGLQAILFSVKEDTERYKKNQLYLYDSKSIQDSDLSGNYIFYMVRDSHVVVIDKPLVTYTGTKLAFNNVTGYTDYSDYFGYQYDRNYGTVAYTADGSNYADGKFSFDFSATNVGNDAVTASYSRAYYNAGSGDTAIASADISKWISFDWTTMKATLSPQLDDPASLKSFNTYVIFTDGYFSVRVRVTVNVQALAISGSPTTTSVAGSNYSFTPTVVGGIGTLTYTIQNKPSWANFNTATGELSGSPTGAANTYGNIIISVSNGSSTVTLAAFSITVPNSPPTIEGTPETSAYTGVAYSFTPTAADANGDTKTFSITNKPAWASFSTTTGILSGTPGSAYVDSESNITISVSDGTATTSLAQFKLTVHNSPPVITNSPELSASPSTAYSYTPAVTNADGDSLSYTIANKPSWAAFSNTTGALTGTPTSGDKGTYADITITVSDGLDDDFVTFDLLVGTKQNFTVMKTGQTVSSADYDDGYYQKGTAKSFTKSGNIVTDNVTGLMWQDSANVSTDQYTWTEAGDYCANLTLDTLTGWRLPTILELTAIVNYGTSNPAADSAFENTAPGLYWSSTEATNVSTVYAYGVDMLAGNDTYDYKTASVFARCVR